jgi:hypothetical protein
MFKNMPGYLSTFGSGHPPELTEERGRLVVFDVGRSVLGFIDKQPQGA